MLRAPHPNFLAPHSGWFVGFRGTWWLRCTCVSAFLTAGPGLRNQVHGDQCKGQHQCGERESWAHSTDPSGLRDRLHPLGRLYQRD